MFPRVLLRRHTIEVLEHSRERGCILHSHSIHHLCDVLIAAGQEVCRLFQSYVAYKVTRTLVSEFLQLAVQMCTTDAHFL